MTFNIYKLGLGAIMLWISTGVVAESIGINFVGGRNNLDDNGNLTSTETAGVIAQQNWNNYFGTDGVSGVINDNLGVATGLTFTVSGVPNTWSVNTGVPADSNAKLMKGYLDTINNPNFSENSSTTVVELSNIPYNSYDVYLYFDGDYQPPANTSDFRSGDYTVGSLTKSTLKDIANWPITTGSGVFTEAVNDGDAGNYTVFSGLSDANLTITAMGGLSEGAQRRGPLSAIQIVLTPGSDFAFILLSLLIVGRSLYPKH